jgi:tetratricopeptide (TPR) repeat protein
MPPFPLAADSSLADNIGLAGHNPLTYVAFLILTLGWVLTWYFFSKRLYPVILQAMPERDRKSALHLLILGIPETLTDNRLRVLRWRYVLIGYGVTLVFIVIVAGLCFYYWTAPTTLAFETGAERRHQQQLGRIEALDIKLKELAAAEVPFRQLLPMLAIGAKAQMILHNHPDHQLSRLADELQAAIDRVTADAGGAPLPSDVQATINLAKARVASARGLYQEIEHLLSFDALSKSIRQSTERQNNDVESLRLLGRTQMILGEYLKALQSLDIIISTPFATFMDRGLKMSCLYGLKDNKGLRSCADQIIERFGPGRELKGDDALVPALAYFVRVTLSKESKSYDAATKAADCDNAADLMERACEGESIKRIDGAQFRCRMFIAVMRYDEGRTLFGCDKFAEALIPLSRAINLLRELKKSTDRGNSGDRDVGNKADADTESSDSVLDLSLSASLYTRASTQFADSLKLADQDRQEAYRMASQAIEDLKEYSRIEKQRGHVNEAANGIIVALGMSMHAYKLLYTARRFEESIKQLADEGPLLKLWEELGIPGAVPASLRADGLRRGAWLCATCVEEKWRRKEQAVQFAEGACELTHWKDGACVACLAAAYANSGAFTEAVAYGQQAINLVPEDALDVRNKYMARQKLYTDHMAFRDEKLVGE